MDIYTKRMKGKKTTYELYDPSNIAIPDHQIEPEQITTIMSTLVVSMLMSLEQQLPSHAKLAREIKLVESAVLRFASVNGGKLDEQLVNVGVMAWNSAILAIQQGLLQIEHKP